MQSRFSITKSGLTCAWLVALGGSAHAQAAVGGEGQGCYPNETCNAGLTCASRLCVKLPGNANAPNGEPVQQTQQVSQTVVADPPKEINNWHMGDPIPPGYHPQTRFRWDFIAVGAASWGFVYVLFNMLPAATTIDVCKTAGPNCDNAVLLFLPVFGPFAQMSKGSAQNSATAMVFLGLDAAAQLAAATVVVVGFAWQRDYLKRNELGSNSAGSKPTIMPYFTGNNAGLVGTF